MATSQDRAGNPDSGIVRARLHPMSLAGGGTGFVLTLLGVWMILLHNDLSPAATTQTVLYGSLVACLWLVGPVARFLGSEVVISGEELLVTTRPFGGTRSARVADIENVTEHAGSLGRLLGYGTVVLYGRKGTGATLRHLCGSADVCRVIASRAKRAARSAS